MSYSQIDTSTIENQKIEFDIPKLGIYAIGKPDKLYLYNEGDECVDITEGWEGLKCSSYITHTITKGEQYITLESSRNSSSYSSYVTNLEVYNFYDLLTTIGKVDLTNYSTLNATLNVEIWNCRESGGEAFLFQTKTTGTTFNPKYVAQFSSGTGDKSFSTDISSYTGEYYIAIANRVRYKGNYVKTNVSQVWLE